MLMIWNELRAPPAVDCRQTGMNAKYPPNITFVIKLPIKRRIDGIKYRTDYILFMPTKIDELLWIPNMQVPIKRLIRLRDCGAVKAGVRTPIQAVSVDTSPVNLGKSGLQTAGFAWGMRGWMHLSILNHWMYSLPAGYNDVRSTHSSF